MTLVLVRNVLKTWLLFLGLCALLGFVGWLLGGLRVATLFAVCGLLLGLGASWAAERLLMGMVGGRELLEAEAPPLHATVGALAARAGVATPRLYVIERGPPLALSVGLGIGPPVIALTEALRTLPSPAEVQGVLAHEVAHLRARDTVVQTAAVVVAVCLVETSRVGGWFARALLFVLGPLAAALVHLLLSPKREFEADRSAAALCDSPHGLADALVRLEQASELLEFQANPATEPLYTINPFLEEGIAALFVTHPDVGARVERLRALDASWRDRLRAA